MTGWHHWLDGRESQWTPGVGDRPGGLVCCDSWGRKESDTTERLIWSDTYYSSKLLWNLRSDYPVYEWSESLSCPYLPQGCFSWIFVCSNQPRAFLPDGQRIGNSTLSASCPPSDYPCFLSLFLPLFLPFYQLLFIFMKLCIKVVHAHHLIIK